ncbi:unnamed protein product [Lactuca virosa]|uniref:JmjC domain-containing protein n=1 Tax=Lactuca virosa TaxID=75947 RepID=A0AAU9LX59_9ASTR|nr:unnamed protein product [Lactuca virosa]
MGEEVFPWLKSLPLAPEYHPTLAEFQDPISYIFKIEEEASKYGICKIIPPVSASPKKTVIANLNRSLSARNPDSSPTFTTRQQQVGFCPRKHHRPVQKPVWQSGEIYTVPQFEVKAKSFEKSYLKRGSNSKKGLTALEVETLYWKAHVDKPFSVEYANDMPGSAFDQTGGGHGKKHGKKEIGDALTVGETEWNMRGVSRSKGSLLKFMKEEIPGVTSPMVYISMLFSWFAWHVEDHDFHSLNYMHLGASKTWYGVPRDAAVAFEDVIREHAYGGEINPIVTFATLGEKDHNYISRTANIATPGWLKVARDAAIRRASINCAPMVSHSQLLYDLAISFSSSVPTSIKPEPRSSRLKDKLKVEGEASVKRLFLEDMMQNNNLLHNLGKGSAIVILPEEFSDKRNPVKSNGSRFGFGQNDGLKFSTNSSDSDDAVQDKKPMRKLSSFCASSSSLLASYNMGSGRPTEAAADYLMSADCKGISDLVAATEFFAANEDASVVDPESSLGKIPERGHDGLFDVPIKSSDQIQNVDDNSDSDDDDDHVNKDDDDDVRGDMKYINDQTFECSIKLERNKSFKDSNCSKGRFDNEIESQNPLSDTHDSGKQTENTKTSCDEDSSRMHIFCLQHALEVEQRLRSVGGIRVLLLCHQDYPSLDSEAKLVATECGTHDRWTDLGFRESNKEDKEWIQSALDSSEATHGNRDWAVKLGINLFYSASLSRSPLYSKQMPYNLVIYSAFGHFTSSSPTKAKPSGRRKKLWWRENGVAKYGCRIKLTRC